MERKVWMLLLLLPLLASKARSQAVEEDFTPNLEASCSGGYMIIKVYVKNHKYEGAVHSRDYRKKECMVVGNGSGEVTLKLPLITDKDQPDYCGVRVNETSKEQYVPVAVRMHETLELADDKYYVIKCGLQGFFNSRNESSFVNLQLLDPDYQRVREAVFDRTYILQADISRPDNHHTMRVKNCFSFGEPNYTVPLTDDFGCPVGDLISQFRYNETAGTAEAVLNHMFRFPASNRVHFQCDVLICKGPCEETRCVGKAERLTVEGRALGGQQSTNSIAEQKSGRVQAGTTVYVVEPTSVGLASCDWYPPWLWILCIVLAVLFIIMMIINIFLCSSMTCSCTQSEVIEKEPSIIEEYDPYRSWHGSQYGSRYSLNGKGYTSGASTMNSNRSMSSHSDHYVMVHSRPNSRYSSGHHSLKHDRDRDRERDRHHHHHHHHHRGPPSTTGSHYSGKY